MHYYLPNTVYQEAIERISFLMDEFDNFCVSVSGGKDSTVVLNLAIEVARKKNRLPLDVFFLDQEAEWSYTIDYIRHIKSMPEVNLLWVQIPVLMTNAASNDQNFLQAWEPGQEWLREKEDGAITENIYDIHRFHESFGKFLYKHYNGQKACYIAGVRAEESPVRALAMHSALTYKHITWAKRTTKKAEQFTFYPIYDWSYTDVWKYIHDNKIPYCKLYDLMYQYGVDVNDMRVSNLIHETALKSLDYMQEVDRDIWNGIVKRVKGVNTVNTLKTSSFTNVKELPFMFASWAEYVDYLLDNLITNQDYHKKMRRKFDGFRVKYKDYPFQDDMEKAFIKTILANDIDFTKLDNWRKRPMVGMWNKWYIGKIDYNDFRERNEAVELSIAAGIRPMQK